VFTQTSAARHVLDDEFKRRGTTPTAATAEEEPTGTASGACRRGVLRPDVTLTGVTQARRAGPGLSLPVRPLEVLRMISPLVAEHKMVAVGGAGQQRPGSALATTDILSMAS
jgi:hypothetical protein